MVDLDSILKSLVGICQYYEKSAPAVSQWADDLFMRLQDGPHHVMLGEVLIINHLTADGYLHPNFAQNTLYHQLDRLELSTVGMIDH